MTITKREAYPLQWPSDWERTPNSKRTRPQFQPQFARDRDSVIKQLKRRYASNIVITSDLPLRNDGLPYANASCSDPGIAVWWVEKGREQVIACDRWQHVNYNLRAIDKSLEALRGLDRWGATQLVERAFAGFAALPSGEPTKRPWRVVIGGIWPELPNEELLSIAKARYRAAMKTAHPDAGGDGVLAAELAVAMEEAEKELAAT